MFKRKHTNLIFPFSYFNYVNNVMKLKKENETNATMLVVSDPSFVEEHANSINMAAEDFGDTVCKWHIQSGGLQHTIGSFISVHTRGYGTLWRCLHTSSCL